MKSLKSLLMLPALLLGPSALASPTLTFDINWNEVASPNPLPHGTTASVIYDASRLGQCRGTTNTGGPAWTITGYYSFDGGVTSTSFWVAGFSSVPNPPAPSVPLPSTSGTLTMWFQVTNIWGCSAWDSDYGANYHFNIY